MSVSAARPHTHTNLDTQAPDRFTWLVRVMPRVRVRVRVLIAVRVKVHNKGHDHDPSHRVSWYGGVTVQISSPNRNSNDEQCHPITRYVVPHTISFASLPPKQPKVDWG